MEMKKILMGFGILVILIVLYRYFFTDPTVTSLLKLGSAKEMVNKPSTTLSGNAEATDFTYSVWIYVKDWNYKLGKDKSIIKRISNNGDLCPEIKLDKNTNDLHVNLQVFTDVAGSNTRRNSKLSEACRVTNIPLQKWTHITITTNNRALDTYIDGKLVKTCLLEGPPKVDGTASVRICDKSPGDSKNGFDGYVAKARYYSRTLNPREIYEIYKEGFSQSFFGTLFNRYKLRFSYIKDNQEVGSLEI
tara:strand:+ start:19826 stop:20566 length:741 start_codon:yes stop_codon:yes gene_type:complete